MLIRRKKYKIMVKAVVSTGRRNHAYASLFAGVKKFLMLVSNEVGRLASVLACSNRMPSMNPADCWLECRKPGLKSCMHWPPEPLGA